MDERAVLSLLADWLPAAGDDAAVVDGLAVTTDMLHDRTDFPDETTRYTAGWRAVGASLSDLAAMGAEATATVAVYAALDFEESDVVDFVDGAADVSAAVGGEYVGGDMDTHEEFTVSTTAVGRVEDPVYRSGAARGEAVCVTGTLGRSMAALALFESGDSARANDLFRFEPRVAAGRALASHASAMMDSSDGLARSLHQLAEASGCGMAIERPIPADDTVVETAEDPEAAREQTLFFGEDFELVCTIPEQRLSAAREATDVSLTRIGTVTESGVTLDGDPLPDEGYTHGD